MTSPQPPHGQPPQPGVQPPGYPQQGLPPQGHAQPGYPQQPAHPQQRAGYPQQGGPQQAGSGPGRIIGFLTAAIAIIAGLVVLFDGMDSLRGIVMCVTGGLVLIAGGVLLILRLWFAPFVVLGGGVLLLGNLVWAVIFGLMTMDRDDTIAEALLPFAGIATFLPGLVVTVLAFLPVVRKSLKPKPGGSRAAQPVQFGGYPQQGGFAYPPQQAGYPQQQGFPQQSGYPQQPGHPPQQPGGYPQQ